MTTSLVDLTTGATRLLRSCGQPRSTLTQFSKAKSDPSGITPSLRFFCFKISKAGKAVGPDKLHLFCDGGGNFIAVIDPDTEWPTKVRGHLSSFPLITDEEQVDKHEAKESSLRAHSDQTQILWPGPSDFLCSAITHENSVGAIQKLSFRQWMSHIDRIATRNNHKSFTGSDPTWKTMYSNGLRPAEAWKLSW